VTYSKIKYNQKLSPFTISSLSKNKALIQSFKPMEFVKVEKELPKFSRPLIVDLKEEEEELLTDLRITNFSAPMDFDGNRIL